MCAIQKGLIEAALAPVVQMPAQGGSKSLKQVAAEILAWHDHCSLLHAGVSDKQTSMNARQLFRDFKCDKKHLYQARMWENDVEQWATWSLPNADAPWCCEIELIVEQWTDHLHLHMAWITCFFMLITCFFMCHVQEHV